MKAIMIMFDSLNRHMLPSYGCDWTKAPNFKRLADKTLQFNTSYVCSMPCMPARRDLHTGRPNFLHRGWGPMEPYDDSVFEILSANNVYTHITTDHQHYFEDGGSNYCTRYDSWDFHRGQEGDPWIGQVRDPEIPQNAHPANATLNGLRRNDLIFRNHVNELSDLPQAKTFTSGMEFIERNRNQDNWFLQIETFDPHEPFFSDQRFKDEYPDHYQTYKGPHFDWPNYDRLNESHDIVEHCRHEYAATLTQCDYHLGKVLDLMDQYHMWKDTMLIVWTDHGFLLGEHDWWGKMQMPFWEEIARTPFFIWDPRSGNAGAERNALVQPSIDLGPTLLDFFDCSPTKDILGKSLTPVIENDTPVRDAALFGIYGKHVNVTDGRYVYMRATADRSVRTYEYVLMPCIMRSRFPTSWMDGNRNHLSEPFSFTKDCRLMRIGLPEPTNTPEESEKKYGTQHEGLLKDYLYDLAADPEQTHPLEDPKIEQTMQKHLIRLMNECDAPAEQFRRLGLNQS